MKVFKSMRHTEIHCAFRTLEILDIRQLGLAPLGLAMCRSAIWPTFLIPLVLL
jgi:hypothetical protein